MNHQMNELDSIIAWRLARVHPLNLPLLRAQLLLVLSSATGIGPDDIVFAELAVVRDVEELARVNWEGFSAGISMSTCLPEQACWALVEHVRLFAERSVLHHCLCLSRSASTLWLMNSWPIPPASLPDELIRTYQEFEQWLVETDRALLSGRAHLHAFQCQVPVQRAIHPLQNLLKRANACYADYLHALDQADQLARYILWHLSQTQESAAEQTVANRQPAWHAA